MTPLNSSLSSFEALLPCHMQGITRKGPRNAHSRTYVHAHARTRTQLCLVVCVELPLSNLFIVMFPVDIKDKSTRSPGWSSYCWCSVTFARNYRLGISRPSFSPFRPDKNTFIINIFQSLNLFILVTIETASRYSLE